jgi:hypothetical protein
MARINSEVENLEVRQNTISEEIRKLPVSGNPNYDDIDVAECIANWQDFSIERRKSIAKLFINKVTVTDNNIDITFR